MSPACAQQATSALQVLMGLDGTERGARKVAQLHDNANYVRSRLLCMGLEVLGCWDSPIVPVMVYSISKLAALSRFCLERGLAVMVVGAPATPPLLTRVRLCVSAAHTREDLDGALSVLEEAADLCLLRYRPRALHAEQERHLRELLARTRGPEAAAAASIARLAAAPPPPSPPQQQLAHVTDFAGVAKAATYEEGECLGGAADGAGDASGWVIGTALDGGEAAGSVGDGGVFSDGVQQSIPRVQQVAIAAPWSMR